MADDDAAVDAEERRPAVLRHIEPLAELLERRHQEERAELREQAAVLHGLLDELQDGLRQALCKF